MPIFDTNFLDDTKSPEQVTGSGSIVHFAEQDLWLATSPGHAGDTYVVQVNANAANGNPLADPQMEIRYEDFFGNQTILGTVDDGGSTNGGLDFANHVHASRRRFL